MVDQKTRQKLIRELEKSGNVYLACLKVGVERSSFYRWKKEDKRFRSLATEAIGRGRENNCDVAEHALMLNVKDKKMEAIKYVLSHHSPRYKPKPRKVYIEHSNLQKELQSRHSEEERRQIDEVSESMKLLGEELRKRGSDDEYISEDLFNHSDAE